MLTYRSCVVSEVAIGKECLYPGHCTFAYCQEEIDVWTLERKGFISRELLFDPYGPNSNVRLTVPKVLQEHHGIFMFLCGVSIYVFFFLSELESPFEAYTSHNFITTLDSLPSNCDGSTTGSEHLHNRSELFWQKERGPTSIRRVVIMFWLISVMCVHLTVNGCK